LGSAEAVRDLCRLASFPAALPSLPSLATKKQHSGSHRLVVMLKCYVRCCTQTQKIRRGGRSLARAASSGELDAVRLLIRNGANPTSPEVLIGAASSRIPDVVQEILKYRPNVNARGTQNSTDSLRASRLNPFATLGESSEIVQILLEAGANPTLANDKGKRP